MEFCRKRVNELCLTYFLFIFHCCFYFLGFCFAFAVNGLMPYCGVHFNPAVSLGLTVCSSNITYKVTGFCFAVQNLIHITTYSVKWFFSYISFKWLNLIFKLYSLTNRWFKQVALMRRVFRELTWPACTGSVCAVLVYCIGTCSFPSYPGANRMMTMPQLHNFDVSGPL